MYQVGISLLVQILEMDAENNIAFLVLVIKHAVSKNATLKNSGGFSSHGALKLEIPVFLKWCPILLCLILYLQFIQVKLFFLPDYVSEKEVWVIHKLRSYMLVYAMLIPFSQWIKKNAWKNHFVNQFYAERKKQQNNIFYWKFFIVLN